MNYFPPDQPVPEGLQTRRLRLEPLHPRHVDLDYEAVIASRAQLRLWSGSSWPGRDFTRGENLADLQWHWREHQAREAFTDTVLTPPGNQCLGCVYLRPLRELAAANPGYLEETGQDESLARFWVRSDCLTDALEEHLLQTLVDWFGSWPFSRLLMETRAANRRQKTLFDSSGLVQVMSLEMPERGGTHHFYGLPA